MGILGLIYLTCFVAVIAGAVMLIQMGGWLAILSAILIIIHFFLTASLLVILGLASAKLKKQEIKKENEKV